MAAHASRLIHLALADIPAHMHTPSAAAAAGQLDAPVWGLAVASRLGFVGLSLTAAAASLVVSVALLHVPTAVV